MSHRSVLAASALMAAMLLAVVAFVGASGRAEAAFPGENGRIAFTGNRVGEYPQIYSMNPDGSDHTRLSDAPGDNTDAAWSADGQAIAFANDYNPSEFVHTQDVYVMDADGSDEVALNFGGASAISWFPTNDRLLAASQRGPRWDLYELTLDAQRNLTGTRRLTNSKGVEQDPAVSPDGTKVAFTKWCSTAGSPCVSTLYVKDIVAPGQTGSRPVPIARNAREPDWSPDGKRIAFVHAAPRADGTYNAEIYTMDADGANKTRITRNDAWENAPAFSPDGKRIVFYSQPEGSYDADLWKMRTDGSGPTRLTNLEGWDYEPDWQPLP